jgi:hypothetical protein
MAQTTLTLALFRYANPGGVAGMWLCLHRLVFGHMLARQGHRSAGDVARTRQFPTLTGLHAVDQLWN